MNILYARSHLSRKNRFRLLTQIVKTKSAVTVLKSALNIEGQAHLQSIIDNERKVEKEFGHLLKVLLSKRKKNSLIYPFLQEPSLELLIERALIAKNFSQLNEYFQLGLKLITQLPSKTFSEHPDLQHYQLWFSQEPDLSQTMVELGVIDITAGNLIVTRPQMTVLDCEWVLPFPVEKEFIAFRYLWNLVTRFSSLLKMYPQHLDLLRVAPTDLVIPREWLISVLGTNEAVKLQLYLQKEAHLQDYILEFQKDVVPTLIELVPYEQPSNTQVVTPVSTVASARFKELTHQINTQHAEIAELQDQLYVIHHSRWWQLLYLIKHPRLLTARIRSKIQMQRIRIESKLRRLNVISATGSSGSSLTDLSTLQLKSAPFTQPKDTLQIDIIIPVFNAAAEVRRCVQSVLLYSPKSVHVYLIDDDSTDEDLLLFYQELSSNPQISIHRNKQRQGFVKNINLGFKLTSHDVIILNTDTEVTENWAAKLCAAAYSLPNIATVTPMTNNGEIVSIPDFVKPNLLSEKYSLAVQNIFVEQFSAHQHITVPTGVGFCMYIRREVIDTVGDFDADTFGMGYGEENDFCQRAIHSGYVNIVDDSTFIYHRGSSSFTSKEKQEYIQDHLRLLFERYPTYESQVHSFIRKNPLYYMQELFRLRMDKPELFEEPAVLFLIHKNPFRVVGGVEVDVRRMLESVGPTPMFFVLHRDDDLRENCLYIKVIKDSQVIHEFTYRFEQPFNFIDLEHAEITWFWQWMLKAFPNIQSVHFEHTYGMPLAGLKVFSSAGKKVLMNFHDFYYACPYEKLINKSVQSYTDIEENLDACYKSLKNVFGTSAAAHGYQQYRHSIVTDLFKSGVSKFIFNSQYTLDQHRKLWPKVFTRKNSIIIEPYV